MDELSNGQYGVTVIEKQLDEETGFGHVFAMR